MSFRSTEFIRRFSFREKNILDELYRHSIHTMIAWCRSPQCQQAPNLIEQIWCRWRKATKTRIPAQLGSDQLGTKWCWEVRICILPTKKIVKIFQM